MGNSRVLQEVLADLKSLVKMWIKEENVSISLEKISTCRFLGLNWTGGGIGDRTIGSKLTFKAVKEKLSKLACEVSSGGK